MRTRSSDSQVQGHQRADRSSLVCEDSTKSSAKQDNSQQLIAWMMYRYAVLLVALVASGSFTEALQTRACTNQRPQPASVEITGCAQMPCELIRGSDVAMRLEWEARK